MVGPFSSSVLKALVSPMLLNRKSIKHVFQWGRVRRDDDRIKLLLDEPDATFPPIEQLVEANLRWRRQDGKPIICAATSLSIYRKI